MGNLIIIIIATFGFILHAKVTENKVQFNYLDYCLAVTFVLVSLISFIDLIFS